MKKIGDVTSTATQAGEFTNGNVAAGIAPTLLEGAWFNALQREILNVLLKANIKQDPEIDDQLTQAIEKLAGTAFGGKIKQTLGDSTTDVVSQKTVTDELKKTVSIDEVNKKLDKSSVLQTTGVATDKVMSQNAVTYALKNKQDEGSYANNDGSGVIAEIFRRNLGLGEAALKNVGMGVGQIPDMRLFTANLGGTGWFKIPVMTGSQGIQLIIQFGSAFCANKTTTRIEFPLEFPVDSLNVVASGGQYAGNLNCGVTINSHSKSYFTSNSFIEGELASAKQVLVKWIAIGY